MVAVEGKTKDLRVRRTHIMLCKAFLELIKERDFQSITVQDIADRAMVNRATFYDHFVDKYALLEYSIREMFKQTLQSKVPGDFNFSVEHLHLLILTTCEYLFELRHGCMPKDHQLLPMVQTQITTVISEILFNWIEAAKRSVSGESTSPQLAATITSWAIYGAAFHWSQQNGHGSSRAFVDQTLPMILTGLNQATNA